MAALWTPAFAGEQAIVASADDAGEQSLSSPSGGKNRALLPSARSAAGTEDAATAPAGPHGPGHAYRAFRPAAFVALVPLLLLAACAQQVSSTVKPGAPGFLLGVWHGFIFPVAFILSLFMKDVAVYAVPNDGVLYNLGYFIGIVFIGVGARSSHVVYRDRIIRERVIDR
jgi:hypothetical protein